MTKPFTDKEYKLIEAISLAIFEYKESIDQLEEMNEHSLIEELVGHCEILTYECFKLQHSDELCKALERIGRVLGVI